MKNQVFKCVLLLGIALLGFGCSNDSDVKGPVKMISELNFGDASASTKTTLSNYAVSWASTDEIGIMNVNDATSNYRFKISSGSGSATATFHAYQSSATDSTNYLAPGTYVAYYPYISTARTAPRNIGALTQRGYLGAVDYLFSARFTVNTDGSISTSSGGSTVLMEHLFTLIKVNVKLNYLKAFNVDGYKIYLDFINLTTQGTNDGTPFASQIYYDSYGNPQFNYASSSAVCQVYNTDMTTYTNNTRSFNLFVRQLPSSDGGALMNLEFEINARFSDEVDQEGVGGVAPYDEGERVAIYKFTQSRFLTPGDLKTINFTLNVQPVGDWSVNLTN